MGERKISTHLTKLWKGAALAALGVAVTASLVMTAQSAEKGEATMQDLKDVDELKALVNADKGSPRLVLLFSPT